MDKFFSKISKIKYEGVDSDNPLSFKYYNPEKKIGNKTMAEHLRFSVAYWHTLTEDGSDPFGVGTMQRSWDDINDPMQLAKTRVKAAFEFMDKLGVEYFCFHDRDIAPTGDSLKETNQNLDEIVELIKEMMDQTGIDLLWGTSQLFVEPKYMHGAATSPNADVFARAAAQVKKAMEITKELGGENYVFWGGREGYQTLLNTKMGLEQDNMARFFEMAVDYAEKIGFDGQFLIEPKPKEPTKHQYDFDVANVLAFLRKYGLEDKFKMNIEANHATLAGHDFQHELHYARANNVIGSVDANQGDKLIGWDTDQFPTDIYATTLAMYEILKSGGLEPGGLNFDAKVRRPSFKPEDLFHGHIAGMDTFARGLEVAHKLLEDKALEDFVEERYSSYQSGIGKKIVAGETSFEELAEYTKENQIVNSSGRQEMLESILNQYLIES
ncbi:xylose isomerase [Halanaerobacter jeridensis]|uniref:Xylose isomerase n=1 Tax=Halanaerobacter jeridensis TaxID=706427 RepID=A0A939BPW3_9FIRM|nr:xylose isomerase [Halanaerobacter jeridensis]MBM7555654.1 xylose isomerase [Halanaerobacter jeridensis]